MAELAHAGGSTRAMLLQFGWLGELSGFAEQTTRLQRFGPKRLRPHQPRRSVAPQPDGHI